MSPSSVSHLMVKDMELFMKNKLFSVDIIILQSILAQTFLK